MPRPLYSSQFAAQQGLNGSLVISFPPGLLVVLRDLDVYNGAGGIASAFLRGSDGQAIWAHHWELGDSASLEEWRGRQVLNPGQSAEIVTDVPMDVSLSGYVLTPS